MISGGDSLSIYRIIWSRYLLSLISGEVRELSLAADITESFSFMLNSQAAFRILRRFYSNSFFPIVPFRSPN
jgi:hypothetical protein